MGNSEEQQDCNQQRGGGKREKEDGERERERIRAWPLNMAVCI